MNFDFTEEQQLLADSVDAFMRDHCDFDAHRRIVATDLGYSTQNWARFAELGWLAIPFNEHDGGLGFGPTELSIVFERFGQSLVTEPYLANVVLAGGLLNRLGTVEQKTDWIPRLIAGDAQMGVAYAEKTGRYHLDQITTTAERTEQGWQISGHKIVALNAPNAEAIIVSARGEDELMLFLVNPKSAGIQLNGYPTLDGARAADLELRQVQVDAKARLGNQHAALSALVKTLDEATLCVCAEAVGAMTILLNKTTEYLKTRRQFGVPLSSFQALQHRATEMFIEIEQARSIVAMAVMAAESGIDVMRSVSAAKNRVGRAARLVGQEAIQLHGGIGITDELDVGHYVKRLMMIEALFGNTDWHLQRFAAG